MVKRRQPEQRMGLQMDPQGLGQYKYQKGKKQVAENQQEGLQEPAHSVFAKQILPPTEQISASGRDTSES